jgi:hypothetical protein
MLRGVAVVRIDVSEELSASVIKVTRIGELGTTLAQLATDARCEEILSLFESRLKVETGVQVRFCNLDWTLSST